MQVHSRVKLYNSSTLIIVDAPDDTVPRDTTVHESKHEWNCRAIETVFKSNSDFDIVKICMPAKSKEKDFYKRVDDIFANKTEEDLVVIYYHGTAGELDEDYTW